MMKIKFIGTVDLGSKGINFIPGGIYDVSKEVFEYLKNTFGNVEALDVEPEVKPVEVKEKPKVGTKVVPK